MIKLTIFGPPITKKNSQQIILAGKRPCIIPSTAYKKYEKAAKNQLALQSLCKAPQGPIAVKCLYYMQTNRSCDLTNLMAATHDVLQSAGVIEDDKWIVSVDGSRIIGKDPDPRVEITIESMEGL